MKLHRVKTPTLKPAYIAALLPTGVAINYAGSLLRNMLGVPLFLDSGGTLLVTFIAGPWMGVVCSILQACMVALTLGPIHIVEFLPPSIIAIIVGYAARYGITQTWPGLIGTMIVIQPPAGLDIMHAVFMQASQSIFAASFISELVTGFLDKTVLIIVLMLVFRALPEKFRVCTPFKGKKDDDADDE